MDGNYEVQSEPLFKLTKEIKCSIIPKVIIQEDKDEI